MNRRSTGRQTLWVLLLSVLFAGAAVLPSAPAPAAAQRDDSRRDAWQRPDEVMDALGVAAGSRVADVGCGEGYFVVRLARRVGAQGMVYAVDIDDDVLERVRRRAEDEGLGQVRILHGQPDDPRLPTGELDAALIVNAYHEMREYNAMLRGIHAALKPAGRLGIIDAIGQEGSSRDELTRSHTISEKLVREDAEQNGFHFVAARPGFERSDSRRRKWFFLLFERPE